VAIQAALGGWIIARETVKALRKDVLGRSYGGDVTRTRSSSKSRKGGKSDAPVRQGLAIGLYRRPQDGRQ